MKRFFIGVAGVLVVFAAAVLIAPSLVDWNRYKTRIAGKIESAIGRGVVIGGDLSIALLPRPALVVEDLRVDNLPGHPEPHILTDKGHGGRNGNPCGLIPGIHLSHCAIASTILFSD